MDLLLLWDQELFLWLNGLGSESFDAFWMTVTNKRYTIGFYAILTAVMSKRLGWKNTLWMLLTIALLITFTDQITNLFKDGFKRLRPCHEVGLTDIMRQVKPGCGGKYGYFSGHASNSFAMATFFVVLFARHLKWLRWLFLVAALVAYSRIYIGVHYPLDVISGTCFGILGGWLFAKLYLRFIPNPI
jgi:undecaprenyl-diphosphatase